MNQEKAETTFRLLFESINSVLFALSEDELGYVLSNLTLSLFRTCERDLSDESMDRLTEAIESDDDEEMERRVH